jgi:hypothetical protein
MTVFFSNTIIATYIFFWGLAIYYYLAIHVFSTSGKQFNVKNLLIGNIN